MLINIPKINPKGILGTLFIAGSLVISPFQSNAQNKLVSSPKEDIFLYTSTTIPPEGTSDIKVLKSAPKAEVILQGKKQKVSIVIDISKNVLYHYDEFGKPIAAYLIASGKPSSPTECGLRRVTHIEHYPYRNAPKTTKRYKNPNDYGPQIICLEKIDTLTGARATTGEFIHGNKNPKSLGKHASLGCIRMDNKVIKQIASTVKRGTLILIKK